MKSVLRIAAILLAVCITVALAGSFLLRKHLQQTAGIRDDFRDVKLAQIIAFAERANSAYHEPKDFRHEYSPTAEVGEFPASGLRVYMDTAPTAQAQWVVIRGTANLQDILDDLEFVGRSEHELEINVHLGFNNALNECLPWIVQRLDKTRPVWVTGHSLGGSVAALLVATLDHRGYQNVSAITFGQPKFTDAHGAGKLAHLQILRIVHEEDPIPMLPPMELGAKGLAIYHHFGPEIIVQKDGHFRYLPEHSIHRIDVAQSWANISEIRPLSHDMVKGYLPALKSALASVSNRAQAAATGNDLTSMPRE